MMPIKFFILIIYIIKKMPTLSSKIRFIVPKNSYKKYTAIIPPELSGTGREKKVSFGDRRYEQYKDSVPRAQGGGKWSRLNHLDTSRRASYRARHSAGDYYKVKYSPSWFSYYFLW